MIYLCIHLYVHAVVFLDLYLYQSLVLELFYQITIEYDLWLV